MESRDLAHALEKALRASRPEADSGEAGNRTVVVLGVGSELRADDAAGVLAASRLTGQTVPGLHAVAAGTAPENHTGEIRRIGPWAVVIVDAADMGKPPGTVRVIPIEDIGGVSFSTHTLPLHIVADYLRRETGCAVAILGIQPASLVFDDPVSPEVERGVSLAVEAIRRWVEEPAPGG